MNEPAHPRKKDESGRASVVKRAFAVGVGLLTAAVGVAGVVAIFANIQGWVYTELNQLRKAQYDTQVEVAVTRSEQLGLVKAIEKLEGRVEVVITRLPPKQAQP